MWLMRCKTVGAAEGGEVLPPVKGPVRRIEITVERHSVTRISARVAEGPVGGAAGAANGEVATTAVSEAAAEALRRAVSPDG